MNTYQKLYTIFSYQDKLIQLAEVVKRGGKVDPDLVTKIAVKICEVRETLK